jgi:glucose-1-phosphate thymidylyltransferase
MLKGIILAGGSGTRMFPLTKGVSKQLLPIYDKPMVYYPLSILMLAGIKDILVITTPKDNAGFVSLLGDGSQWGIHIEYVIQEKPNGIAEAFLIGAEFIGSNPVALILGDNIFYGDKLPEKLQNVARRNTGATIFTYKVNNPWDYGVVYKDKDGAITDIIEKPINTKPLSDWAVTGLYFYDNSVVARATNLRPSYRNELEITDLNKAYLASGELKVEELGRGSAWLDTGTPDSLLDAGLFVRTMQQRQGLQVACLEEIALNKGYITIEALTKTACALAHSDYKVYLLKLVEEQSTN